MFIKFIKNITLQGDMTRVRVRVRVVWVFVHSKRFEMIYETE